MAFVRSKTFKNKDSGERTYYYLVENKREGGKVVQKTLEYLGKSVPEGYKEKYKKKEK